jgi:hypothetical protein
MDFLSSGSLRLWARPASDHYNDTRVQKQNRSDHRGGKSLNRAAGRKSSPLGVLKRRSPPRACRSLPTADRGGWETSTPSSKRTLRSARSGPSVSDWALSWSTMVHKTPKQPKRRKWRKLMKGRILGVVGANGFEPSTSWSRTKYLNPINALSGVAYGTRSIISPS